MIRAAVFDVDGTILRGRSAERTFILQLFRRGVLGGAAVARYLGRFVATFPRDGVLAFYNRTYLRGKSRELCEEIAEECFQESLRPRISPDAVRTIERRRAAGHEIVLLSGTLDFLLERFRREVGADRARGTVLEAVDGVYTGEVIGPFVHGPGKVEVVRREMAACYDLEGSWSFADSRADFEMLRLFGHPVLVNATGRLARRGREAGFEVAAF